MRFSIDEYSKEFKMSKEMLFSKLRNKKLNYVVEDGITYIIVPSNKMQVTPSAIIPPKEVDTESIPSRRAKVATVLSLYQKENHALKNKIKELEDKIDQLISDKEQMLRDERDKIEQVYLNKDEQLRSILELVNSKMIHEQNLMQSQSSNTTVNKDSFTQVVPINTTSQTDVEADIQESEATVPSYKKESQDNQEVIALKKHLKSLELNAKNRKTIKKRFTKAFGSDVRIIQQNGEFFLDFSKYDYSDLLQQPRY
jgi:ElaB/YqjD/DUF883 family membrane-anchored ribosome-binding protein